ncbi:MAG: ABC transporter permease [Lachnospiraceae bacterium]|nr:ABC transporter permease [Lachnospiraceae bacterium]
MTVFKTYFKIAKKHMGNFIMYTAIFLSITMFIAQNNINNVESYAGSTVRVAIFDEDNSDLSKGLTTYLDMQHELVTIDKDLDAIRDALYIRKAEYVITIPQGFETAVLESISEKNLEVYKLPGSVTAQFVDLSIDTFLSTYKAYLAGGFSSAQAYEKTLQTIEAQSVVSFYNKESGNTFPRIHYFYVYIPYALISITILCIGPMLIGFQRTQIKDRVNCSKVSSLKKNMALLSASSLYTLVIVLFYFIISLILYSSDVTADTILFRLLNVAVQAFVCLSFTFLFSLLTKKVALLSMFSNVFGLGSSFLCGIFVPREYLSDTVANIGRFLPAYWYVNVENAICEFSPKVYSTITTGYLVQVLYGVAVLVIALVIGQYQRRR